jgi:hypothetical protein
MSKASKDPMESLLAPRGVTNGAAESTVAAGARRPNSDSRKRKSQAGVVRCRKQS